MLPLYDNNPSFRRPYVTYFLIFSCIVLYFGFSDRREVFSLNSLGLFEFSQQYRLVSHMFMHLNLAHLFGNMLFLWIFGDNIEEIFGGKYFLAFFLVVAVFSGVSELLLVRLGGGAEIRLVGASGAIAGVMGAYLRIFPRIKMVLLLFIIPVVVPVWLVLGVWVLLQFYGLSGVSNVAYVAHISGFTFGFVVMDILVRLRPMWLVPWLNYFKIGKGGGKGGRVPVAKKRRSSLPEAE